jgi:hypothetical protein
MCAKFGVRNTRVILLIIYEFHEKWHRGKEYVSCGSKINYIYTWTMTPQDIWKETEAQVNSVCYVAETPFPSCILT